MDLCVLVEDCRRAWAHAYWVPVLSGMERLGVLAVDLEVSSDTDEAEIQWGLLPSLTFADRRGGVAAR